MLMPRRSFSSASAYKFGFNGKENDNEVKGLGNQQDYGMRIYDGRVGRFLSTDPLFKNFPWYTPYQFAGNRPIVAIDLEGLEPQEHPYQLQPIGKTFTGVTTEGYVYSSYQVNSPTNGQTWVAKIEQIYDLPNGFKGSIDYFLYYNKDAGWQFWQKGDELSIGHRRRVEGANIIGQGTFWIAFGTAAAFAAPVVASTSWELWVGAHSVPEFIPYFAILGGMSSVGLKGAVGTAEPENIKPTVEQLQIPEEVGPPPAKQDRGLSNPYKNMSLSEVEAAMERQVVKGKLIPKPSAPGNRAYQNTKSKYSYNLDPGSVGKKGRKESPHVDVNYPNPKPKNVPPKKKLPTKEQ
jgi:RHS repeat-associated protein